MTLWSAIASKLKEIWQKMFSNSAIENALDIKIAPIISNEMEQAIKLWDDMYKGKPDWIHEPDSTNPIRVVSLGIPAMIASEKARTALIEFNSEITVPVEEKEVDNPDYEQPEPDEFGNLIPTAEPKTIIKETPKSSDERAKYLNEQYTKLKKKLRTQLEYGIAKGGLVIKPYLIINNPKTDKKKTESDADIEPTTEIEFDFIQADNFYPLAFDASGRITEAAFVQTKVDKTTIYRRLEYHKWENNKVTVINKAFKTNNLQGEMMGPLMDLGKECPLSEIPEWKDYQEKTVIKNVEQPLFSYFKMPEANTIDTNSPLGVSGYSRATSLIKDADLQYSRLLWEYEAGEMAIDIDRDALKTVSGPDGVAHEELTHMQERLFRKVDLSATGETYNPFAPALRDTAYIQGLNTILMRIEDVCGVSRGTISDAASEARTATELKILKQRSYQTNADIQQSLEDSLREVIYIMNVYCDLYQVTKAGEYDVSFEWDDSIITDVDAELSKRITLMQQGLVSKIENRMWYFGESERQAREALTSIREDEIESAEDNITNFFGGNNNKNNNKFQKKKEDGFND